MRTRSTLIALALSLLLSVPVAAAPANRDDGDSVWMRSFRALQRIVQRVFVPITNSDGAMPPIPSPVTNNSGAIPPIP